MSTEPVRLFIPDIGDKLVLAEGWSFDLHNEYRNESLFKYQGLMHVTDGMNVEKYPIVLPIGTQLSVDRVYIRRGKKDYSSITFNLITNQKGIGRVRFWATLADANKIVIDNKWSVLT